MICTICKQGETQAGHVTVTLERGGTTIVFKGVPALVCENCGEAYLDEAVVLALWGAAETAVHEGVEVVVRHYVAA
jgi:YgiT-type zinc finger domain-containing protein